MKKFFIASASLALFLQGISPTNAQSAAAKPAAEPPSLSLTPGIELPLETG